MEYLNRKWFEVVWSLESSPLDFESDVVEADEYLEAEEKVRRMYGSYENGYEEVDIQNSRELQE